MLGAFHRFLASARKRGTMYDVAGVIRAYPSSFAASDEGFLTRRATYEEFSAWLSLGPASASGKPFKYSTVKSYLLVFYGLAGGFAGEGKFHAHPFFKTERESNRPSFINKLLHHARHIKAEEAALNGEEGVSSSTPPFG